VVFFGLTIPVSAVLADRIGGRAAMILASVLLALFGLSFGLLFAPDQVALVALFLVLGQCLIGMTYGPLGTFLSELYPAEVRYTGASLSFNLAGILGASLAPSIATWLASTHGVPYVGWYLTAVALVSLAALVFTGSRERISAQPA
jgi:MFS family permease